MSGDLAPAIEMAFAHHMGFQITRSRSSVSQPLYRSSLPLPPSHPLERGSPYLHRYPFPPLPHPATVQYPPSHSNILLPFLRLVIFSPLFPVIVYTRSSKPSIMPSVLLLCHVVFFFDITIYSGNSPTSVYLYFEGFRIFVNGIGKEK